MLRAKSSIRARRDLIKRYDAEIADIAEGLAQDAPGLFYPLYPTHHGATPIRTYRGKDLLYRRRTAEGQQAISAAYEAADQTVIKVMGKGVRDINLPSLDVVGSILPGRGTQFYTIEEALQALKLATSGHGDPKFRTPPGPVHDTLMALNKGGGAINVADGPDTFNVRQLARTLKEDVLAAITLKSPATAEMYRAATTQYRKDYAAWEMLNKSGMWEGETQSGLGPVGDPSRIRSYMKLHPEDFGENLFPNTAKKLYPGALPGAEEVVGRAGLRGYFGRGVSERFDIPYTKEAIGGNPPARRVRVPAAAAYLGANAISGALAPTIQSTVAANEMQGGYLEP